MLKGMEKGKMVPRGSANRYARNISGDKSKGLASGWWEMPLLRGLWGRGSILILERQGGIANIILKIGYKFFYIIWKMFYIFSTYNQRITISFFSITMYDIMSQFNCFLDFFAGRKSNFKCCVIDLRNGIEIMIYDILHKMFSYLFNIVFIKIMRPIME